MTTPLDEKLEPVYQEVLRRNPGELEFHQAVREVLECLGPVMVKHPEFVNQKIIERICEPERQIIFRVPWQDDRGEVQIKDLRLGAELAGGIASRSEYASQRLAQFSVPEADLVSAVAKALRP